MATVTSEQELITIGPYIGIDATTSQFFVDAQHAVDSLNIVPDRRLKGFVTAKGRTTFSNALPTNVTYSSDRIFKFQSQYLAVANNGDLYKVSQGGTPVVLISGLTDTARSSFVTYETWCFFTTASDTPRKIDTSFNVTNWGIVAPTTTPTVAVGSTGNLFGDYQYVVTFANATQESSPSPISAVINPGLAEVNLTAIPTSPDTQVTQRNIYRIGGTLSQFQLIAVLNDNTTTTYTDNTADINVVGQTLILHRDPPESFFDIVAFKDRIWGLGYTAQPNDVWYSNYKEPWGFDNTNQVIPVGRNIEGDNIVGGGPVGSVLVVLKRKTTQIITGDNPFLALPAFSVGCVSKGSIAVAYDQIFWLSDNGIYQYNGSLQNVSYMTQASCSIKGFLDGLSETDLAAAVAFFYQRIYYISFPTKRVTYGYQIDTGQWHKLGFYTSAPSFDLTNSNEVTTASQDNTQLVSWFAAETDLGASIGSYYISGIGDSSAPELTKQYLHILCLAPVQTGATVTVTLTINPGLNQTVVSQLFDLSVPPPRHLASVPPVGSGFEAQIELACTSSSMTEVQRVGITGYPKRRLVING